jgi:hypothetical protein
VTRRFLESSELDPDAAPLLELGRRLAELQKRYRTASHGVAEQRERPEGIHDATYEWWIAAQSALWRRRFVVNKQAQAAPVEQLELRKDRLRKPSH